MNKLIAITAITLSILVYTQIYATSCLERPPFTYIKDKNSIEYLENVFPLCVHTKQCDQAVKGLEKLKTVDQVRYAYLKGAALANGDCFKKDLNEAERRLSYCAKYSKTCRDNLFNLYASFYDKQDDYLQFALALASEGNRMAYSFLAGYYGMNNTLRGKAYSYFWALVLYDTNKFAIDSIKLDIKKQRDYIKSTGNDPDTLPGLT